MADGRLPLNLLGGFLGAGKTTWLRHQLHHGLRAHVVVNEAAGVSVDHALLSGAAGITELAGGCACCEGRGAMVAVLRDLVDRRSRGEQIADLVLETSGLADPAAVLAAIAADPVLVHHIRMTGTVVLVDAVNGLLGATMSPLALAQMRAADRLILTKTDAVASDRVARLAATLSRINPMAEISAAVAGQPVALPEGKALPLDLPTAAETPLHALTLALPPGADWAALSLWLSALLHRHGDRLLRIKGVVDSPAGRLLIQTVRHSVQPPEVLPEGHGTSNLLAVIGTVEDAGLLSASLAQWCGE